MTEMQPSWTPAAAGSVDGVIAERLPILDELLAERGVALEARPLRAACDFVELRVLKVRDASGKEFKVSTATEVVTEKWFGALYQAIERWYRRRYDDAFKGVAYPHRLCQYLVYPL